MYIELDDDHINKLEKDLKKYFIDLHRKGNMVDVEDIDKEIEDIDKEIEAIHQILSKSID